MGDAAIGRHELADNGKQLVTVVGDGVTDDTAALMDCITSGQPIPAGAAGLYRVTQPLAFTANASRTPGVRIRGPGMLRGTIIADYNGDAAKGGVIEFDTAGSGFYTFGIEIADIGIQAAPGRTGINGITLTAAWMVHMRRVMVKGLPGIGMRTPWRPDINTTSDFYQCFALDLEQCWVEGCSGNGIDFGAGQSPGIYRIAQSQIIGNGGIGLRSTTGQCEIIGNVISYNGVGGLEFDTLEGPSMVGRVIQNEIQDNQYWGLNLLRSHDLLLEQNRFLSDTYSEVTGGVPQSGTPYMRQQVQVKLGSSSSNEVWNLTCRKNLHRSVFGPNATTATCFGYDVSNGSLSAAFPCVFEHNDFGPTPFDGITQNSTSFLKFSGSMPGAVIIDP